MFSLLWRGCWDKQVLQGLQVHLLRLDWYNVEDLAIQLLFMASSWGRIWKQPLPNWHRNGVGFWLRFCLLQLCVLSSAWLLMHAGAFLARYFQIMLYDGHMSEDILPPSEWHWLLAVDGGWLSLVFLLFYSDILKVPFFQGWAIFSPIIESKLELCSPVNELLGKYPLRVDAGWAEVRHSPPSPTTVGSWSRDSPL